jgi:hemerythrin-like metal-binding protein
MKNHLTWSDSYKIGDASIDAEHEHAFGLANAFLAAQDQKEQQAAAMQLYKHAREHFLEEENLMRKINFPDCKGHTERHNALIGRLNVISHTIGKDGMDKRALATLMTDWAMHHIVEDDAKLVDYIRKHPA